jgi:Transglutaminase-like superfamily
MRRAPDLATLRALVWAGRSLVHVRRSLRHTALPDVTVAPPPSLPPDAVRGVRFVLGRRPNTCLQRALVLQAWHAAQGSPREVVIGVTSSRNTFSAHAWLDGALGEPGPDFEELLRLPAR